MKRGMLQVVAAGVVASSADVERYLKCRYRRLLRRCAVCFVTPSYCCAAQCPQAVSIAAAPSLESLKHNLPNHFLPFDTHDIHAARQSGIQSCEPQSVSVHKTSTKTRQRVTAAGRCTALRPHLLREKKDTPIHKLIPPPNKTRKGCSILKVHFRVHNTQPHSNPNQTHTSVPTE
jgi:hypothetical protein